MPSILPELDSGRGTARRVVEGETRKRLPKHETKNGFQISQHVARADAQGRYASLGKPGIAPFVPLRAITKTVCVAIDLDCKPGVGAKEIDDVSAAGMLPPELQSPRAFTQLSPKDHFRQRHLATQPAGLVDLSGLWPWRNIAKHVLSPSVSASHRHLPETSSGRNNGAQILPDLVSGRGTAEGGGGAK
jgi:hypothetical protein